MRRSPVITLKAVLNASSGHALYANNVVTKVVDAATNYIVLNLDVNAGVSYSIFQDETAESLAAHAALKESVTFVEDNVISLASPDKVIVYFTIDLNTVVPAGWMVTVQRLTKGKPTSLGVIIVEPGHEDKVAGVHLITNVDYREQEESRCENLSTPSFSFPDPIQCEREAGHLGKHQAITKRYVCDWEGIGVSGSPFGDFGFKCLCPICGFVTAGRASGVSKCSLCSFWLEEEKAGGGFVIEGRHYRPGLGGFGGHTFHIQRNNGTKWTGELFTQGSIPSWMMDRFPNNAVFLEN